VPPTHYRNLKSIEGRHSRGWECLPGHGKGDEM